MLFHGIQFLLTGFSRQKEKDLEGQIWKHGGIVLFDIPSPISRANRSLRSNGYQLPIILCSKKVGFLMFLTIKFDELPWTVSFFFFSPFFSVFFFALFGCLNGFHGLAMFVIYISILALSSMFCFILHFHHLMGFLSFGTSRYVTLVITLSIPESFIIVLW